MATMIGHPKPPRFSLAGFSPQRVAYALCVLSVCLLPIHYLESPCEVSVLTGGLGFLIALLVLGLCFASPRGTTQRFRAAAWGFLVYVVHALSTQ